MQLGTDRAKADTSEVPLRPDLFTTANLSRHRQSSAWANFIASILEVEDFRSPNTGFSAVIEGYNLGKLRVARCDLGPMQFKHSADHIRRSGIDHWCLTVLLNGEESTRCGARTLNAAATSLSIQALSAPFRGRSTETSSIRLFLSRDDYADQASLLDALSFRPLAGPLMSVLRDYICALADMLPAMRVKDIPEVINSFNSLLSAVLAPTAERLPQTADTLTLDVFCQARNYIQKHLDMPNLGSEVLCQIFGISRRQLYYLFQRSGGVATYIKRRRLEACRRAIVDTTDHRLISTIAYSFGFEDAALFSKQFQIEFGCSPREARAIKLTPSSVETIPAKSLAEWLIQTQDSQAKRVAGGP